MTEAANDRPVAPPHAHVVVTDHVQRLLANALDLAKRVDGKTEYDAVGLQPHQLAHPGAQPHLLYVMTKAVADARHAADELEAEVHSILGLAQV